jgi:hypothetical protein
MKNLSLYVTAGLILLFLSLVFVVVVMERRLSAAKMELKRVEINYGQLNDSTRQHLALILTLREILSIDTLKIDSLSKALKIRPKTILQYVNIEKKVHDTVEVMIPVVEAAKGRYWVLDSTKCWKWGGYINISGDSISVTRKLFDYHDRIEQMFFWERERKFLFIHFGKKRYYQKTSSDCGSEKVLVIDIKKK